MFSSTFTIDICAYAVMSNHYHLVAKLDSKAAKSWSYQEVITRWINLYKGPLLVQRQQQGEAIPSQLPPTLERLTINARAWVKDSTQFEQQ